jgi:hypothetical protein
MAARSSGVNLATVLRIAGRSVADVELFFIGLMV